MLEEKMKAAKAAQKRHETTGPEGVTRLITQMAAVCLMILGDFAPEPEA